MDWLVYLAFGIFVGYIINRLVNGKGTPTKVGEGGKKDERER